MKKYLKHLKLVVLFVISGLIVMGLYGCEGCPLFNHSPRITSTPVTTAEVNVQYTYDVDATDPDGDVLTYSLDVKPTGMVINSSTGVITWTPTSTQTGTHNIVVKVSDGRLFDSQSFVITVTEETVIINKVILKYEGQTEEVSATCPVTVTRRK